MQFDIIICTYNRPTSLINLIGQIETCSLLPARIIVVDSSDEENHHVKNLARVTYIRSSHKNQPYQRFVGYTVSTAEVLVFLDDDLELVNQGVFKAILDCYKVIEVSGVSGGVDYESVISNVINNEVDNTTTQFKLLNFVSGVPNLEPGKIYPMGLAGPLLKGEGKVEYFHGPFMSFKRTSLHSIYDPVLFSLYEEKLGKGEDKVVSMKVGLNETLWYLPTVFFKHPPVASHYFSDIRSFYRRLAFSRLHLSKVFARYAGQNTFIICLRYYYFMLWRLVIAAGKFIAKRSPERLAIVQGYFDGLLRTLSRSPLNNSKIDWKSAAKTDAKGY